MNSQITKLRDWFYLDEGKIDWLWRGLGLTAIPISFHIWTWSHGGPGPFVSPAWRVGAHLIYLPMPPAPFDFICLCLLWCASILMFTRTLGKLPVFISLAYFVYFGSCDWNAIGPHFVPLQICALLCLLFNRNSKSLCRRLLQITICLMYLLSALQKLTFPDFVDGSSFQSMFSDGWLLNPFVASGVTYFVKNIQPLQWMIVANFVILFEVFLGIALLVPRLKYMSLVLAFVFHFFTGTFLHTPLQIFAVVACLCLLVFIEPERGAADVIDDTTKTTVEPPRPVTSSSKFATACTILGATLYLALNIALPLRIYFWSGRPISQMTFLDRTPWTYGLFIMRNEVVRVTGAYFEQGWHEIPEADLKAGRFPYIETDNDLIAAANYLSDKYAAAKAIELSTFIAINKRWGLEKAVLKVKDKDAEIHIKTLQTAPVAK